MASRKTQKPGSDKVWPVPGAIKRPGDPESLQAKPWTFEEDSEGQAWTDLHDHVVHCPSGTDDRSHGMRTHEMLHVAMSPIPAEELDGYMLAAEDARIESVATKRGIHRHDPIGDPGYIA